MLILFITFLLSSKSPGNYIELNSSLSNISTKYSFCFWHTSNCFHPVKKKPFRWEVNFETIWKIQKLFLIWVKMCTSTIYQVIILTHFQCADLSSLS